MVVMAEEVAGQPARGKRYGLFTAASGPVDLPEPDGLAYGIQFEPVSCGTADLYPVECDDTPPEQTFDAADPYVLAQPFLARSTWVCGPVGTDTSGLEDKVRRRLANGEQSVAEAGMAVVLASHPGLVNLGATDDIVAVVGELEQWLYGIGTANYGNVGVIHAPPRVLSHAMAAQLVVEKNNLLVTRMGTVWSIGGGYPDDDRIYISGATTVFRAATVSVPPARQLFDHVHNTYRLVAEREYAVAFECSAAWVHFNPDIPVS